MEESDIKDKILSDSIDCTNASARTVKSYYDRGFPVRITKDKWMPFMIWYMKTSVPGSEHHSGFSLENDQVVIQKNK